MKTDTQTRKRRRFATVTASLTEIKPGEFVVSSLSQISKPGGCTAPYIRPGDVVTVRPRTFAELKTGAVFRFLSLVGAPDELLKVSEESYINLTTRNGIEHHLPATRSSGNYFTQSDPVKFLRMTPRRQ